MRLKIGKSTTLEDLVKKCRKKDSGAQRELFERLSRKMLAVCFRYVNQRTEAEDIMISAFMKVFDNIHQFKSEGSFEGWVRRIMVNESLSFLRRNKFMWAEADLEQAFGEPDFTWADASLNRDDLMGLINELPVGYRTVFNLYAIEGYSHREVADMLGINENTSKSQLSRARVILQDKLLKLETRKKLQENGQ